MANLDPRVSTTHDPIPLAELAGATGRGARVLVVDSGVDPNCTSLFGADLTHLQVSTHSSGAHCVVSSEPGDPQGHGTAVTHIIHTHAPGAVLTSLRLGDPDALSARHSGARVVTALEHAIENRYDVVNVSLVDTSTQHVDHFRELADRAYLERVLIVASGPNFGARGYPAALPTVIGTDSARLTALQLRRNPGCPIEFDATGEDLALPGPGGQVRTQSGTSFAAAHVSALVARIRELRPSWNHCQVVTFLYRYADDCLDS